MSREDNIDYGEIKNISTEFDCNDRHGDYGHDSEGFMFLYTPSGWKPINNDRYESKYWKKKYIELLNTKQ